MPYQVNRPLSTTKGTEVPSIDPVCHTRVAAMYDGVKLRIQGRDQQRLRSHYLLSWKPNGVDRLGRTRYVARWGAFTFKGDATRCTLMKGSFHIHYHGGENWADFTREQFAEVVASVCIALGLHSSTLRLANLEVGVNVIPPIPTPNVLECIVLHRTQRPTPFRKGIGVEVLHAAYRFKIYDKARHRNRPGELLRFEVAVRKMRTLAGCRVVTLSDLMEPAVWSALRGYLLARFDELLIVEPEVHAEGLRPADRELLARASDPNYWVGLTKGQRSAKRKRLTHLYARRTADGFKATLRRAIVSKLSEVTDHPTLDLYIDGVPVSPEDGPLTFAPTGKANGLPEEALSSTPPLGRIVTFTPHVIKGAKVTGEVSGVDVRRCLVCDRDITCQDPRSRVCSERLYGKDGKRCRNTLSNRTLTLRRMDVRSAPLFDQLPFMRSPQQGNTSAR